MGIGGAVMNVPILKFFGYTLLNKAIGSAAAIGFLIALFGAIGFLISGSYLEDRLTVKRIGFLNIPAFSNIYSYNHIHGTNWSKNSS